MNRPHTKPAPPRLGMWMLRRLFPDDNQDAVQGDFLEVFESVHDRYGPFAAQRWFWWQLAILIPQHVSDAFYWHFVMLKNYLNVTLRNLSRNPIFGLINIVGLAAGLSCCALIMLFVADELRYDRFHEGADDIYRLRVERYAGGGEAELTATASAPMAPAAVSEISQIEAAVRVQRISAVVRLDDQVYQEEAFFWADSTISDVFTLEAIQGDLNSALTAPYSIVLTEESSQKYFSSSNPMGRTLEVNGRDMTVTGVVKSWPEQSHFTFDFLGSFSTKEAINGSSSSTWNWWSLSYHTYFRLTEGADTGQVQAAIREMPSRYIGDQESVSGYRQFLYLQPLVDIHLTSHYRSELEANSQKSYVFIFGAVALFILVIACVNFMNLSTARSAQRAREVGMRKVCGAHKRQLIGQFLGESVMVSLMALLVAFVLIQALLPVFNNLAFKSLSLHYIEQWPITLLMLAGAILVGFLAGVYPAFMLSAFNTVQVLKGSFSSGSKSAMLRQGLVMFQFTISIVLIIAAIIAQRQLGYMRSADLGFDKEQTLVVNARGNAVVNQQHEALKSALNAVPGVRDVSISSSIPGRPMGTNVAARVQGMTEEGQTFYYLAVDHEFARTYGLDIIAGRDFSQDRGSDDSLAWVLNEAATKALGWASPEEAIGEEVTRQFSDTRKVIGVVRDFNYQSLQYAVEPIILFIHPVWYNFASIRLSTEQLTRTLSTIEQTWKSFSPDQPMEYFFLDEDFDRQYRGEERISSLLGVFTMIAILIACLGLFALASYVAQQRRKEIGVRKVLGASTGTIVVMLSSSFARLVLLSTLIAIPVSWIAADKWLDNFQNRIEVSWDIFALAGAAALFIALLTISYQSIRAASANPADTLRTE